MQYRIYTLTKEGRIFGAANVIEAASDEDAIGKAKRMQGALALEVWQGDRVVTKIEIGTS